MKHIHAFAMTLCIIVGIKGKEFMRLCYFTNWSNKRDSPATRFNIQDIDVSLCSHLVYAFAKVDSNTRSIVPTATDDDPGPQSIGRYREFNSLKNSHPHLKTLLSVGGENAQSKDFVALADNMEHFAKTTVDFLRKRGFDGLDIDWEFPENSATKTIFNKLLKTLRTAFEDRKGSGPRLLLTAALSAGRHVIDSAYDVRILNRYLDYANLMTYDYHGSWNDVTGFNSPLFSRKSNMQFNQELSTNWTVNYYISKGLAAGKILVGVTPVGRRFVLVHGNETGVGAPVNKDIIRQGELYQIPGRATYPEMCRVLQEQQVTRVFDQEQCVPYAFVGDDWYGYEDAASLERKVQWMLKLGIAGVMFWSLDLDDFTGKVCDAGKYPLLKVLTLTTGSGGVGHNDGNRMQYQSLDTKYESGYNSEYMSDSSGVTGCMLHLSRCNANYVCFVVVWAVWLTL